MLALQLACFPHCVRKQNLRHLRQNTRCQANKQTKLSFLAQKSNRCAQGLCGLSRLSSATARGKYSQQARTRRVICKYMAGLINWAAYRAANLTTAWFNIFAYKQKSADVVFFIIMRYTYIYFAAASTPRVERVLQMKTDEYRIFYKCADCLIDLSSNQVWAACGTYVMNWSMMLLVINWLSYIFTFSRLVSNV